MELRFRTDQTWDSPLQCGNAAYQCGSKTFVRTQVQTGNYIKPQVKISLNVGDL